MSMTHYMELLASHQPWNLIIFMAIPVILAETIAITELYLLFTRNFSSTAKRINKWAGIIVGIYFVGVFIYLFTNAVVPVTMAGEWKGFADVIAVGFYLLGVVPLGGIALLELGFLQKNGTDESKLKLHAVFVAIFLVVAHIAMIFGMVNPDIYSKGDGNANTMNQMSAIPSQSNSTHMMADGTMMGNVGMDMSSMMNEMTTGLQNKNGYSFDKAFLAEMIVHHQGAVDMAEAVLQSSHRPELIELAKNIITTQTEEIAQMKRWQKEWYK